MGNFSRKELFRIFVRHAAKQFAILAGAAVVVCLVLEHVLLPDLERKSLINTWNWERENVRILTQGKWRVLNDPVMLPRGMCPVPGKVAHKRILVIGDSFVWGDGYADLNTIWWRQLERELHRRGYNDVEVIAMGQCGWSTRAQLEHLPGVVAKYLPDAIIWGYCTNDPDENIVSQAESVLPLILQNKPDRVMSMLDSKFITGRFPYLWFQLRLLREHKLYVRHAPDPQKAGFPYEQWELEILKGENWDLYGKTVSKVAQCVDTLDRITGYRVPYFFLTLPNFPDRNHFGTRYSPVKELFEKNGIVFYDLLPGFVEQYGKMLNPLLRWAINPANGHPGKIATRYYAEQAANILEKHHPEVLPPKGIKGKRMLFPPAVYRGGGRAGNTDAVGFELPGEPYDYHSLPWLVNDWAPVMMTVEQAGDSIVVDYPRDNLFLKMPGNRPYIQLGFADPARVNAIEIQGAALSRCRIGLFFDDDGKNNTVSLPEKKGGQIHWKIDPRPLSTITIGARFADSAAHHRIVIHVAVAEGD